MLRRLVIVLIVSVSAATASAGPAGPGTSAVKQANDTISDLIKQKAAPEKVTAAVRNFLDVDELGKAAMVNQWSKLTKPQQDEFLKVLHELIEANYAKGMNANVQYKVSYLGETADPQGHIIVNTTIDAQRKNRPIKIKVDYVLVKQGAALRAFDVKTDDVGLVDNYRAMFDKIIKDKGFPALVDTMKKKAAELAATPAPATTPATPAPTTAKKS